MAGLATLDHRWRTLPPARGMAPRALLVLGALLVLAAALGLATAMPQASVEPELALLLRFMGGVKAVLGLLALGLVAWRLGRQAGPGLVAAYCLGTWGMLASAVLVWQLTRLGLAAGSFHLWTLLLLFTAVLDGRAPPQKGSV